MRPWRVGFFRCEFSRFFIICAMLNYIWLGLVVCAVLIGGWNGQLKEVSDAALDMANTAVVKISFTLIGVMALWLGIMRLAERAGLVALLARAAQVPSRDVTLVGGATARIKRLTIAGHGPTLAAALEKAVGVV